MVLSSDGVVEVGSSIEVALRTADVAEVSTDEGTP